MDTLQQADPEVWQAIEGERRRQQQGLELIASENYTSPAVMAAQGSVLTNKYAEGLPGKRYYGGGRRARDVGRAGDDRDSERLSGHSAHAEPPLGALARTGVAFP